ncbi:helix-turn-helix domain-containing protein [Kitasatospora sp. NPDC127059]|uniref:helix-turn-helix domain-containing protein n=1 Tax=unclassified Kitasatospora TaxID=2633591 RepID=UPI00365AA5FF
MRVTRIGSRWRVDRPRHPGLRPFVHSYAGYWETEAVPYRVRLVPTGRAVLVINIAEPFSEVRRLGERPGGSAVVGSLVAGLEDGPRVCAHPGGQEAIRLELTPLGAYRLFSLPMRELTNTVVELAEVLGPVAAELVERLAGTRDWAARFDLVDAALLDRLGRGLRPAPEVAQACRLLSETAGGIRVARLAAEVGWSHGYLVRRFVEQVGLTPKGFARVLRFHRAAGMLSGGGVDLNEAAVACGFYDQAHLSRDVRALAGLTPGRLAAAHWADGAVAL